MRVVTKRWLMLKKIKKISAFGAVATVCCVLFSAASGNAGFIPAPPPKVSVSIPAPAVKEQAVVVTDVNSIPVPFAKPLRDVVLSDAVNAGAIPVPSKPVLSGAQQARMVYKALKVDLQGGQWEKAGGQLDACREFAVSYPAMSWHCGLAAWKAGEHKDAAAFFEAAASIKKLSREARAGAYYWASRAYAENGKSRDAKAMLKQAHQVSSSGFYGSLAAYSLKQAKLYNFADYPDLEASEKRLFDIDPALVHAIVRQESRFNTEARSHMGATGLMQLMPATALYIAKQSGIEYADVGALMDPDLNLDLGQRYIRYLLDHRAVSGDLVSLLIAYNAGPGNLQNWRAKLQGADDALLFVELMPSTQTQEYVKKVMVNYWAYRQKQGRGWATIAAIGSGKSVSYDSAASDISSFKLAQNRRTQ